MQAASAVETPELNKRSEVAFGQERPADTLTSFYDWLVSEGIVLAKWGEPTWHRKPCPDCPTIPGHDERAISYRQRQVLRTIRGDERERYAAEVTLKRSKVCPVCHGTGALDVQRTDPDRLHPYHEPPEKLFARFFGLNLAAIDAEQRALLEAIRGE